jgi:hypothetical protein
MIFTSDTIEYVKALMAKPIRFITPDEFRTLETLSRTPRFKLHDEVIDFLFANLGTFTDSFFSRK